MKSSHPTDPSSSNSQIARRGFLSKMLAIAIGGVLTLFPFAIGILPFLDPLKKKEKRIPSGVTPGMDMDEEGFIKVVPVNALKDPNSPAFFEIRADHIDAWNYFTDTPVGSIYLYRTGDIEKKGAAAIVAFNTTCPHLGCAVEFKGGQKSFYCPCHNSSFDLKGKRSDDSPSPRDLDSLETKIKNDAIWVKFIDFRTGIAKMVEKT